MDKTFGFDTAVEEAQRAINSAYIEVGRYCSVVSVFLKLVDEYLLLFDWLLFVSLGT